MKDQKTRLLSRSVVKFVQKIIVLSKQPFIAVHTKPKHLFKIRSSPEIWSKVIQTKGVKIYPYRFDSVPAKLRLNRPVAVMISLKVAWIIRAVQCTLFRSQRTSWLARWKKKKDKRCSLDTHLFRSKRFRRVIFELAFPTVYGMKTSLNAKPFRFLQVPFLVNRTQGNL